MNLGRDRPMRVSGGIHQEQNAERQVKWRNSKQIRGCRVQLVASINACDNGAYVTLDFKMAKNLLEICDQAIHTEEGHGV